MPKRKTIIFWISIVTAFLATRLINLLVIPIFTDEAIYSYWAQIALHDPANRFISLEDGKQPLFIWLVAVIQKFIEDPLIAIRLVSVISGLASTVIIYYLSKTLFSEKVARLSAILYIILPFTLLYDRLGLYDSLLTSLGLLSVLLTAKMAANPRLDLALLNGFAIGLGLITKSSAQFFLLLIPFSLVLFSFKNKDLQSRAIKWIVFSAVTAVLSLVIYNALRVAPLFYIIDQKNHEFIRSFAEVLQDPFLHFNGNLNSLVKWQLDFSGPILAPISFLAILWGFYKREFKIIFLSIYVLAPFSAELLFNQILYPRFSLFFYPYLIILISYVLVKSLSFKKVPQAAVKIFWFIALAIPVISSFLIITNPPISFVPLADKEQYFNSWPAGYGVKEAVTLLKSESKANKVYVGTEGTFGLLPFALQIYFYSNPNVKIEGFWPVSDVPQQVLDQAKNTKTYFIFNFTQKIPENETTKHLKLINKYQKGIGDSFMRLYQVSP